MLKKYTSIYKYIVSIFFITFSAGSEELNMKEILEIIQKDLRTLERAVYSESFQKKSGEETSLTDKETEDVLTRHLLKLSEIEKQFQNLTNKLILKLINCLQDCQKPKQTINWDFKN